MLLHVRMAKNAKRHSIHLIPLWECSQQWAVRFSFIYNMAKQCKTAKEAITLLPCLVKWYSLLFQFVCGQFFVSLIISNHLFALSFACWMCTNNVMCHNSVVVSLAFRFVLLFIYAPSWQNGKCNIVDAHKLFWIYTKQRGEFQNTHMCLVCASMTHSVVFIRCERAHSHCLEIRGNSVLAFSPSSFDQTYASQMINVLLANNATTYCATVTMLNVEILW